MRKFLIKMTIKIERLHEWIEDSIAVFMFVIQKEKGEPLEKVLKELKL